MIDYLELLARLLTATLVGCAVGLDRNLHGKPTGMKTLGLVALGASLATMASLNFNFLPQAYDSAAVSRTIQGIITGIGFLGAGVIVHSRDSEHVHGLTTAASIWVTAAIGIVCGMGWWKVAGVVLLVILALFLIGRPLERTLHRRWMAKSDAERAAASHHEE